MSTVTYSPEDNKLRLYVGRVPRDEYEELRKAGFVSTPKQDCDFAATWTPQREDLAREYLEDGEDIGDEDYSPLERSADRAERFEGYREKRTEEAGASADAFQSGPAAFGHQSQARAERQARRHDRTRTYAVSQWSKAEYWQTRTAGVIAHALYRSSAQVRRGRVLTLEAELRKAEKSHDEYARRYAAWQSVLAREGTDAKFDGEDIGKSLTVSPALKAAYTLANYGGCYGEYQHPRKPERKTSLYSLLTDAADPITAAEAANLWLAGKIDPANQDNYSARWKAHLELRLTYERAMLAQEGGSAAEADMEPGGWIGGTQIQKVNRSTVTGRVVSVTIRCQGDRWGNTREGFHMRVFNIERLPEGAYRPPTDEEREQFKAKKAEAKAAAKATKPKEPSLINPTDEDAERLQAMWNERAAEEHKTRRHYGDCPVSTVWRMTQAEYSQRSKGTYGSCGTSEISELLTVRTNCPSDKTRETVFKIRTCYGANYAARRVIVLTDKPQKPIPWTEVEEARAKQPTEAELFPRLEEIAAIACRDWNGRDDVYKNQLFDDARYIGWTYRESLSQYGLTAAGKAAYERFKAEKAAEAEEPVYDAANGLLFA